MRPAIVLYVDDEEANRTTFRYVFDGRLTNLKTASSGEEALRIAQSRPVSVLIADQRMPGMTGVELCERFRETQPDTLRMILTAYADLTTSVDAINRGAVHRYFAKPVDADLLCEAIDSAHQVHRLRAETRVLEARLLQDLPRDAMDQVRAEISHELSNVLQLLLLDTQALQEKLAPQATQVDVVEHLGGIMEGVEQLTRFMTSLADRSRLKGRCNPVSVALSVEQILGRHVRGVAALEVRSTSTPDVPVRPSELAQVLVNLILNARHAIAEAGGSRIQVVVAKRSDGCVAVRVLDDGPGIPAALREDVFGLGYTTRPTGTGSGLTLCRRIVLGAGGSIEVLPVHPRGTEICIVFPAGG